MDSFANKIPAQPPAEYVDEHRVDFHSNKIKSILAIKLLIRVNQVCEG